MEDENEPVKVNPEQVKTLTPNDVNEPPKKRRGRPPKNPELLSKENVASSDAAPKRGRPKKRVIYDSEKKALLSKQIVGLHIIASQVTGFKELEISEPEAVMLCESLVNVSEQYGLSLDGKTGALIQLAATAGMIYLPRFVAVKKRQTALKKVDVDSVVDKDGNVVTAN